MKRKNRSGNSVGQMQKALACFYRFLIDSQPFDSSQLWLVANILLLNSYFLRQNFGGFNFFVLLHRS